MKRIYSLIFAVTMLLSLCACKSRPVTEESPTAASATAAPSLANEADTAPILSPGAADNSHLSALFQSGGDGTTYTSLVRGQGITCLYDILPEDIGCVAGFFMTEEGIYAAIKDSYFSLEPAALYFFPADGTEGRLLAENVFPAGLFCMAGEALFYENYDDESLWRLDISSGETRCVLEQAVKLLGAGGGFIYYTKDGGVYCNDSTMSAETRLFDDSGVSCFFIMEEGLCLLTYDETGGSIVEMRLPDGTLHTQVKLDEYTDGILCREGRIYVPQTEAGTVLVLDFDGNELNPIPLTEIGFYCQFYFAGPEGLYYETTVDETSRIYCIDLETMETRTIGEMIIR